MKKLNRILSLSAAAALALSLTACSGGPSGTADTPAGGRRPTPPPRPGRPPCRR